jgi:hypothetical protein
MMSIRAISLAGLSAAAIVAISASAFSYSPSSAQTRAEATCEQYGVRPHSAAWELCLSHVTRAYEWGEFSLASQLAHAAGQADESCLYRGISSTAAGYRSCISHEIEAKSELLILGDDRTGTNVAAAPSQ